MYIDLLEVKKSTAATAEQGGLCNEITNALVKQFTSSSAENQIKTLIAAYCAKTDKKFETLEEAILSVLDDSLEIEYNYSEEQGNKLKSLNEAFKPCFNSYYIEQF